MTKKEMRDRIKVLDSNITWMRYWIVDAESKLSREKCILSKAVNERCRL